LIITQRATDDILKLFKHFNDTDKFYSLDFL